MSTFELSPAARDDVHAIWDYIADDNLDAADRVIDQLHDAMQNLSRMPHMGHEHQDLADETLRVWPVYTYLIIYRPDTKPLQIVRVLSGFRDLTDIHFGS